MSKQYGLLTFFTIFPASVHLLPCALIAATIHWCASRALGLDMRSLERIMGGLGT